MHFVTNMEDGVKMQFLTSSQQLLKTRSVIFWVVKPCCSVEVEVKLRPTVSRPVRLDVRHPSGTLDQFFFLLEIFFRQLRVCYFVAPSLTRRGGLYFPIQLLLVLARAVTLGSKSRRTHSHILLSHLRLHQSGRPGPRIYIPQEQGGPVIPPGTGLPLFCCLLRLAGLVLSSNPTVCIVAFITTHSIVKNCL
jgi:hypothetical protein